MEVVRWGEDRGKHGWDALPIQIRLQKNLARHINGARLRPQIENLQLGNECGEILFM